MQYSIKIGGKKVKKIVVEDTHILIKITPSGFMNSKNVKFIFKISLAEFDKKKNIYDYFAYAELMAEALKVVVDIMVERGLSIVKDINLDQFPAKEFDHATHFNKECCKQLFDGLNTVASTPFLDLIAVEQLFKKLENGK